MGGAPSKGRLAKLVSQTNSNERFRRVDTDNSGSVSLAELQQVLSDDWNEDRIRKLIAVFDDDGNEILMANVTPWEDEDKNFVGAPKALQEECSSVGEKDMSGIGGAWYPGAPAERR